MRLALEAGSVVAPTGSSTTSGAAPRRAATRCSRRSPGCGGRSATPRSSPAATAGTRSRSTPTRSTRSRCVARRGRGGRGGSTRATPRGAAELSADGARALPRGPARRGRRLGRAAPRAARGGARRAARDRLRGPAARSGDDVIGELEAAVAAHPVPGAAVGAADHRALPAPAARPTRSRPTARSAARLADDLGLEPGPRLRELEQPVLDHDPALPGRGRAPPPRPGTCRRSRPGWSVATPRSPRCPSLLGDRRLVEVVGPGGIGKTARRDRDRARARRRPGRRLARAARGRAGRPTTSSTP